MDQKIPLDRDSFEQFIATASILQQLQQRAEYLERHIEDGPTDLANLIETQQEIQTGSLSTDAALLRIVSLALKLLPARGAAVWLFEGNAFVYRAGAGTASDDETLREAVRSRLSDKTFAVRRAEIEPATSSPYASLLVAPVFPGPKIAGALAIFSDASDAFSGQHVVTTKLLAGLAANAIDKAATAQFKHMVSLERAIVLQVIDSTVPRLSGLIEVREHSFPGSGAKQDGAREQTVDQGPPFVHFENVMSPEALAEIEREIERYQPQDPVSSAKHSPETRSHAIAEIPKLEPEIPAVPSTAPVLGPGAVVNAAPVWPIERLRAQPRLSSAFLEITARVRAFPIRPYVRSLWRRGSRFRDEVLSSDFPLRAATKVKRLALSATKSRIAMRIGLFGAVLVVMALALRSRSPKASTTQPISADRARLSASNLNPGKHSGPPLSHKTITDSQIANALREMSAFEIPSLRRQAKYGDASAAFQLGMAYETGRGVRQSCVSASEWVREAASAGNPAAEYNLGLRYLEGDGVPINVAESDKWIHKAAAQKYLQAEMILKTTAAKAELLRP